MNKVLCNFALFLCVNLCSAQPEAIDAQRLADELLPVPDPDSDVDYQEQYERAAQLFASPYDLNKVSRDELRSLHLLTDTQIENLLAYRLQQGRLLSLYELQVIPEFDLTTISALLPFVKVVALRDRINASLLQRIFAEGHSYFVARYSRTLETKKGFRRTSGHPAAYAGSADQVYWRFRSSVPGDFSLGLAGEKDSGEALTFAPKERRWGFDFTSWHLQLQNKGIIRNIVIGDFQAQFGQGLLLGGAFGLGKGSQSVSTVRKSNLGFRPYTSINENGSFHGLALSLCIKNITLSSFISRVGKDASLDGISDTATVTAFQQSGYHRTAVELARRKKIREQNAGLVLAYSKKQFDAGIVAHTIRFENRVEKKPTLYNQYAFAGKENVNVGFFLNGHLQHLSFFSEVGHSLSAGNAVIAGLLFTPHQKLDIGIVYRNYARDFHSFYANVLSENTRPENEQGIYWGWKYRWNRQYSLSGYVDLFRFPWLGFRRYAPSQGYEWLVHANYQPSKQASLRATLREESKNRNLKTPDHVYTLARTTKRNLTLSCDYGIGEHIRLKSRVQFNLYDFNEKVTKGIAVVQDVVISAGRFTFSGRHALFDTDSFDNRNYVYEHDAWLSYSFPSYSGTGVRNYALIQYKAGKHLTLWLRYARTAMLIGEEIGSGTDRIDGNTKNDVKFQARFSF